MHTTMVPEQVKTMKIQAGVQVSRPGELRRHLQLWKCFRRLYFVVIILDRNIWFYKSGIGLFSVLIRKKDTCMDWTGVQRREEDDKEMGGEVVLRD
ncbi:hypothetical protein Tco_0585643 [Tanacetum coccineum]